MVKVLFLISMLCMLYPVCLSATGGHKSPEHERYLRRCKAQHRKPRRRTLTPIKEISERVRKISEEKPFHAICLSDFICLPERETTSHTNSIEFLRTMLSGVKDVIVYDEDQPYIGSILKEGDNGFALISILHPEKGAVQQYVPTSELFCIPTTEEQERELARYCIEQNTDIITLENDTDSHWCNQWGAVKDHYAHSYSYGIIHEIVRDAQNNRFYFQIGFDNSERVEWVAGDELLVLK